MRARGRLLVSVYVCVLCASSCAQLFFSIRTCTRGLSVNCIASIKSLRERKRAKAQFWESQRQKLIVSQTDRLIDRCPLQRVARAIGHPICRQFVQKSTLQDSPIFLFFFRVCFVSKTKKEEKRKKEKDRYCRNEGSSARFSRPSSFSHEIPFLIRLAARERMKFSRHIFLSESRLIILSS